MSGGSQKGSGGRVGALLAIAMAVLVPRANGAVVPPRTKIVIVHNLANLLYAAGKSFIGYSESLPFDGSQAIQAADPNDPDDHVDAYRAGKIRWRSSTVIAA